MFTARAFLHSPQGENKYQELPQQLRADPERLRGEFLAIAIDSQEPFDLRTRSLMILFRHSDELGACGLPAVVEPLVTAFQNQFPPEKLDDITKAMQDEDCPPDGFLAHMFCIAFAELAPKSTEQHINAVRETLKGTSLGATLARHLEHIERRKNAH
jgi:hypothetical protein